jgi:hypothetical protein
MVWAEGREGVGEATVVIKYSAPQTTVEWRRRYCLSWPAVALLDFDVLTGSNYNLQPA